MARLYSALLWEEVDAIAGTEESDTVPDGVVWIVREVEVNNGTGQSLDMGGFTLTTEAGAPIFSATSPFVRTNVAYHLTTRQVLEAGAQLVMVTGEEGWSWRISGYVLTLP